MARRNGLPPYLGTLLIWLVTIILAAGIVFAAIVISRNAQNGGDVAGSTAVKPPVATSKTVQQRAPRKAAPSAPERQAGTVTPTPTTPLTDMPSSKEGAVESVTLDDVLQGNFQRRVELFGDRLIEGKRYPLDYTCYRQNKSPSLSWQNIPSETQSLTLLLVRDRSDEGMPPFVNWAVYNISPSNGKIGVGQSNIDALPGGMMQGRNGHRNIGYTGPCEPKGKFPYRFYIFALDRTLPIDPAAKAGEIYRAMRGHVLDYGTLDVTHYLQY